MTQGTVPTSLSTSLTYRCVLTLKYKSRNWFKLCDPYAQIKEFLKWNCSLFEITTCICFRNPFYPFNELVIAVHFDPLWNSSSLFIKLPGLWNPNFSRWLTSWTSRASLDSVKPLFSRCLKYQLALSVTLCSLLLKLFKAILFDPVMALPVEIKCLWSLYSLLLAWIKIRKPTIVHTVTLFWLYFQYL